MQEEYSTSSNMTVGAGLHLFSIRKNYEILLLEAL